MKLISSGRFGAAAKFEYLVQDVGPSRLEWLLKEKAKEGWRAHTIVPYLTYVTQKRSGMAIGDDGIAAHHEVQGYRVVFERELA